MLLKEPKELTNWECHFPENVKAPLSVFVFGSNLAGRHGAGAAKHAAEEYGAQEGAGVGHVGNSYAIPTKNHLIRTMKLGHIKHYVDEFKAYASQHPELTFYVTRIGCGLAGYRNEDIAPMFAGSPGNCLLDVEWKRIINELEKGDRAQQRASQAVPGSEKVE